MVRQRGYIAVVLVMALWLLAVQWLGLAVVERAYYIVPQEQQAQVMSDQEQRVQWRVLSSEQIQQLLYDDEWQLWQALAEWSMPAVIECQGECRQVSVDYPVVWQVSTEWLYGWLAVSALMAVILVWGSVGRTWFEQAYDAWVIAVQGLLFWLFLMSPDKLVVVFLATSMWMAWILLALRRFLMWLKEA